MSATMTSNEEAQLSQTIEMFEVITQSQPLDYQSLEILKEAYSKLGRHPESVRTSKRIAEAYVQLGQLSSAILEYEGILQRFPDDPDVRRALAEIELKATNLSVPRPAAFAPEEKAAPASIPFPKKNDLHATDRSPSPAQIEDGRRTMTDIFVEGKYVSERDFQTCWPVVDVRQTPKNPIEPFIQVLADRQIVPVETSLKLIAEKARACFLPLDRYDVDVDLVRSFPRDVCMRWCVLPFDRMSKSIMVATANPFNKQAVRDLENSIKSRFIWYLAAPAELIKLLRKVFR